MNIPTLHGFLRLGPGQLLQQQLAADPKAAAAGLLQQRLAAASLLAQHDPNSQLANSQLAAALAAQGAQTPLSLWSVSMG